MTDAGLAEGYLSECEDKNRTLEWSLSEATKEDERWRATWALWRPGIENTRDFYENDGNEPRAKAYAAMLRDFDKCRP